MESTCSGHLPFLKSNSANKWPIGNTVHLFPMLLARQWCSVLIFWICCLVHFSFLFFRWRSSSYWSISVFSSYFYIRVYEELSKAFFFFCISLKSFTLPMELKEAENFWKLCKGHNDIRCSTGSTSVLSRIPKHHISFRSLIMKSFDLPLYWTLLFK